MLTTILLIAAVIAYLIGAIPTGLILTRIFAKADIRSAGSGNIGATNVARVAGKKLGILTLLGDAFKGLIPVLFVSKGLGFTDQGIAIVAICALIGHCYPVYLAFRGGKGVATALGIFLVLSPAAILSALILFALVLWKWRYVSLASVSAAVITPLLILLFEQSTALFAAGLMIGAIVVHRHKSNIQRLINGTENKFKA